MNLFLRPCFSRSVCWSSFWLPQIGAAWLTWLPAKWPQNSLTILVNLVTRYSLLVNSLTQVLADPQNLAGPGGNSEIGILADLPLSQPTPPMW